jgi:hypothetical protein
MLCEDGASLGANPGSAEQHSNNTQSPDSLAELTLNLFQVRLKDCADAVTVKVLELLLSPHRTTRALAVSTLVQLGEPVAAFADDVARVMEHADAGCAWFLRARPVMTCFLLASHYSISKHCKWLHRGPL